MGINLSLPFVQNHTLPRLTEFCSPAFDRLWIALGVGLASWILNVLSIPSIACCSDPRPRPLSLVKSSFFAFPVRMASLLVVTLLIMGAVTAVTGGRPVTTGDVTDDAKIAALCATGRLRCADSTFAAPQVTKALGVRRDPAIHTINDIQRDFFLESALVVGGRMTLDANLRDAAPKSAFLTSSAAKLLPALTSPNAVDLIKHFGVAPNTHMATAVATAAYLCGYGALPGEKMTCAASTDAMANFVSAELGPEVHVLSTSNTPASAPAAKAPVTIVDVAKGTVAEGETIVVCHAVTFPSALYYCHRVTGTKVITATLKPAQGSHKSDLIKAVGVCHIDTSLWLSGHPAFRALDIPHGDEACHWLVDSDLLFYPAVSMAKLE